MHNFETHDLQPVPRCTSVELIALRRNSDVVASQLRQTIPEVLAGMTAEVPGAVLEFEMRCGAEGMVMLRLDVSAAEATSALADEIAAVLSPVAEVAITASEDTIGKGRAAWPMVPDASRGRLGFTSELAPAPACHLLSWGAKETSDPVDLVAVIADLPGQGLRTRLRLGDGALGRWAVQVEVVTAGQSPALRLRAALRRCFPDLQISTTGDGNRGWLEVETADLARVLAIPVAGAAPPSGVYVGSAAPIPVVPARPAEGEPIGRRVRIGHALTPAGRTHPVELGAGEMLSHIQVLGRTGTGKSSLLAAMVHEIAAGRDGALVLDPHGQLCDRVLAEIPDSARDRLWVIRCGDLDHPVPINPLAETDPVRQEIAIEAVCDCFQYLFDKKATGVVGPRFRERVAMALRAIAAVHGPRTSILDVPLALASDTFMYSAISECADERVRAWWINDKVARRSSEYGELVSWVNSKFDALAGTAAMRGVLGSGADAIDFAGAMDDGRIILVDLSKSDLGEPASRLLGYLYLNQIWAAALQRRYRERPFSVIVDEAHTLVSGALTNMLAEGRKFGLSVTLAHQYLEQLDEDLRPAVDGNVATTVAFRCAVSDAAEIYRRFGGLVDSSVLTALSNLTAVCQRTAMSQAARPHTLVVDHNTRITGRSGAELGTHISEVMRRTRAELSDPFRERTTAAAAGVSNISSAPARHAALEPAPPAASGLRLAVTPQAKPPGKKSTSTSRPVNGGGSFLDEWLARRAAARSAENASNSAGSAREAV